MDLAAEKTKRDARIKAKEDRIRAEGSVPAPEVNEVVEDAPNTEVNDTAKEEKVENKKPEKKPE